MLLKVFQSYYGRAKIADASSEEFGSPILDFCGAIFLAGLFAGLSPASFSPAGRTGLNITMYNVEFEIRFVCLSPAPAAAAASECVCACVCVCVCEREREREREAKK